MQRAQSHRPFLRITLTTAVAVLTSTTLVACNRDSTEPETTAAPAGEQRDERAGEVQPTAQQTTGQQSMGQGKASTGTQAQTGEAQMGQAQMGTGPQDVMAMRGGQGCPMMVEGAAVEVEDTADGVALRFTSTTAGNVEDLRNRVEHMARMYEMHGGGQAGSTMWHPMGHMRADRDQPGGPGKGPAGSVPAATAKVDDVDNGARLVLTPKDKTQLTALREHVRDHQRRMQTGECWMATEGMGGQGQQDQPGHRPGESAPGEGRPKT